MELTTKQKIISFSIYTIVCVAGGSYLAPHKTTIEKEVQKSEQITKVTNDQTKSNTDRNVHRKKTTVEKILPDGSKETRTEVTEDSDTKREVESDDRTASKDTKKEASKETKVTEFGGSKTTLSAIASFNVTSPQSGIDYGVSVYKDVLGPIGIGLSFGLTNAAVGCSVGVSF